MATDLFEACREGVVPLPTIVRWGPAIVPGAAAAVLQLPAELATVHAPILPLTGVHRAFKVHRPSRRRRLVPPGTTSGPQLRALRELQLRLCHTLSAAWGHPRLVS